MSSWCGRTDITAGSTVKYRSGERSALPVAVVMLFLLSNDFFLSDRRILSRVDGLILLTMFGLFLFYVYDQLRVDLQKNKGRLIIPTGR